MGGIKVFVQPPTHQTSLLLWSLLASVYPLVLAYHLLLYCVLYDLFLPLINLLFIAEQALTFSLCNVFYNDNITLQSVNELHLCSAFIQSISQFASHWPIYTHTHTLMAAAPMQAVAGPCAPPAMWVHFFAKGHFSVQIGDQTAQLAVTGRPFLSHSDTVKCSWLFEGQIRHKKTASVEV